MILSCRNINKAYGVDTILEKVSFGIEDKEKVAIVGVNGAGKTTLFKIITGVVNHDGGELYIKKEATLGCLEQNAVVEGDKTIFEEAVSVFQPIIKLEEELRAMEEKMATMNGIELERHMESYAGLQHAFEEKDGYGYKSRVRGVLKGLGFVEEEFEKPVKQLSGGQKTRVYLSKLLLAKPDILMLDEPTNHLDIDSIGWLEDFLKGYQGAVVIISHDRYFIDKIVTKTIEIENKKSFVYAGNYSFFASQKEINRQVQQKHFDDQQKEIRHQEEVIKTLRSFNREKSIKRAESREKNLEKIERVEKPSNLPDKMRLTLAPQVVSGSDVLFAENLSKSFADKELFKNLSLDIKREDKIAIIGPNGVGKSTLFKMLLGKEKSDSGEIRLGMNVNIGYYDQEQDNFDNNKTVFQEISDTYPKLTSGEIRNVLASFVFEGDDVFKPISALSGGERGRLVLAKIMLGKANLLMLDEPTNHLDMFSKGVLESAINRYEGTVVYISHDRYFINQTAQKVFELTEKGITQYFGNYDYYIEKKSTREREELLFANKEEEKAVQNLSVAKQGWQSQKEQQAKDRKIKNKIAKIEEEIEATEATIQGLEERLASQEVATDSYVANQLYQEKVEMEEKLLLLLEEWEESCNLQE